MKRPHEDKITFLLAYRTQFFYTTCTKLDIAHAFLFERAQCPLCEKVIFFPFSRTKLYIKLKNILSTFPQVSLELTYKYFAPAYSECMS